MKNLLLLLLPLNLLSAWEGGHCEDDSCECYGERCFFQDLPPETNRLKDEAKWPTKNQDPLIEALTR